MAQKKAIRFRIQLPDGKFLNAGTDAPSWFSLEEARKLMPPPQAGMIDISQRPRIVEHDGMNILWEIL